MSGPKIAALYGLVPNELGLCGLAEDQKQLRQFIQGKLSILEIIPALKRFQAAYPYYELIAKKNKISAGSFNKKVVEAYWIGNELLEKTTADDLRELIINKFSGPGLLTRESAIKKAKKIPANSKPHHSFHVLVLGAVTGSIDFAGRTDLKDICRVGWGRIIKKSKIKNQKSKLTIIYQPLVGKKKIELGKTVKKEINWDKTILPEVNIGNWVSFHWNHAIQILNEENIVNLYKYTKNSLDSLYAK
jgi:hydrogenase maturation factor